MVLRCYAVINFHGLAYDLLIISSCDELSSHSQLKTSREIEKELGFISHTQHI